MAGKTVVAKAEPGGPGSLKSSVRIAFVITPDEPKGSSHPYSPIATYVTSFSANGGESVRVMWYPRIHPYCGAIRERQFATVGGSGSVEPGQAATLTSSWGTAVANTTETPEKSPMTIINKSGSKQDILLLTYNHRLVYHYLEDGGSVAVPPSWKLQAYVVNDAVSDGTILQPEDLERPIFPLPVLWDALPSESTWSLTENNGVLRIHNDQYSPVDKKDPLAEVLERLAAIEGSISRIQDDVAAGQKAVDDIRTQLSETKTEVQESRNSINTMETASATLTDSFGQSQDRLAAVQKVVTETQQLFSGMEKSTQNRLSTLEESTCNRFSTLEESASRTQDRVATVEKTVHQTQDHVSLVQQLVVASNNQLSLMKLVLGSERVPEPGSLPQAPTASEDTRTPGVEVRVEKLERSAQEQRRVLRKLPKLEADLAIVQVSVAKLDGRLSAVEVGSGDGEAGLGELSSSPSIEGSPVTFPTHLSEGPTTISH